jgi:predicted lipoprotein with Yx(FWY)xxD motif
VVLMKRITIAAAGALAATLMLAGCNAYGGSDYGTTGGGTSNAGAASGENVAVPKPAGKVTGTLIAKRVPRMGNVVTDAKGWILYRFDQDTANPTTASCLDTCAKVWPPVLSDDIPKLKGVASGEVGTLMRADGGMQVTIGGWPVYRYIGDKKPGAWTGQNVAGTWFVVSKTGKKNLTYVPPISKAVKPPADDTAAKAPAPTPIASGTDDSSTDPGGYSSGY